MKILKTHKSSQTIVSILTENWHNWLKVNLWLGKTDSCLSLLGSRAIDNCWAILFFFKDKSKHVE